MSRATMFLGLAVAAVLLVGCPSESAPENHDHSAHGDKTPDTPPDTPTQKQGAEVADTKVGVQARDPVCGMTITADGKLTSVYENTKFHFCSAACKEKFDASPDTATTGLFKRPCVCTTEMANCDCGHCKGQPERCTCGDPRAEGADDSHGHDHSGHKH